MSYTLARPVCALAHVGGYGTYPPTLAAYLPAIKEGLSEGETLIGFMPITSAPCTLCDATDENIGQHSQIDGWEVITTTAVYSVDNSGTFYRARVVHPFES